MTLDLTRPVTREQYTETIGKLMTFLRQEAADRGWCSERHRYFGALIPEYNRLEGEPLFALVPDDEDYAARLTRIRGTILRYARHKTVGLDLARRGLEAAGLEGIPAKGGAQYSTNLHEVQFSGTDDMAGGYSRRMQDLIMHAVEAYHPEPGSGDEWYVPGSFRFAHADGASWISRLEENPEDVIPASQTVRPSYTG